jgi:hypothetical protein
MPTLTHYELNALALLAVGSYPINQSAADSLRDKGLVNEGCSLTDKGVFCKPAPGLLVVE